MNARRPGVIAAALLAALGCASAGRTTTAPPVVRVMVYNIHAGKDAANVDNLERVAELVRSTGADIVLLQEVDRGVQRSGKIDQPATFVRLTRFSAAFGKTLDYQGGDYGIAVLSRWPITHDTLIRLPVDPPQERSGLYEPRGALRASVSTPWGPLVVVNTHLDPTGDDRWRRQEMRTVIAIADSVRARGTMLLVGGDFNSTPESAVQEQIRASGLRDAWIQCGAGPGFSYPADTPAKRIDYLYLSGASQCEEGSVLTSQASDHRAVMFRIRLAR
jgi:endonuclease/exonuclease/phosphatase family metal-dependent hydrolase